MHHIIHVFWTRVVINHSANVKQYFGFLNFTTTMATLSIIGALKCIACVL